MIESGKTIAAALRKNEESDQMKIVNDPALSTSAKIRALDRIGVKRSAIAELLGKRYQHVRNVLETKLKGE